MLYNRATEPFVRFLIRKFFKYQAYSHCHNSSLIEKFLTSGEPIRTLDAIARFEDGSIRYERTGTLKKYEVEPIKFEEKKEISKKN